MKRSEEPRRILEEAESREAGDVTRGLAALIERAQSPRPLEAPALARVYRRLRYEGSRPSRVPVLVRWALVPVLLMSVGVVAAAQIGVLRGRLELGPLTLSFSPSPPKTTRPRRTFEQAGTRVQPAPADQEVRAPVEPLAPSLPRPEKGVRKTGKRLAVRQSEPFAAVMPRSAPSPAEGLDQSARLSEATRGEEARHLPLEPGLVPISAGQRGSTTGPLAQESAMVGRALAKLRQERDPHAALALLSEYAERFPNGVLAREAKLVRLDAYLLLDRKTEALELLSAVKLGTTGRDAELRVIRAELRGLSGCGEALADFTQILGSPAGVPPSLAERASWGRYRCFAHLGQLDAAERERGSYLERFPRGRFAAELR